MRKVSPSSLYYLVLNAFAAFIRQALLNEGLRLDGRACHDYRAISIKLSRTETSSSCEVVIGETMIVAAVTGEIVSPYPDRPSEGFLLFSTDISDNKVISHTEISRYLERAIRHSDALDLESLCIVGGEKVWQVRCQVNVLDTSGGNTIDACMLAAMAALKAFRRPDISVLSVPVGRNLQLSSKIVLHHSDDREPLPLALQHTPLALTLGIFKRVNVVTKLSAVDKQPPQAAAGSAQDKFVFVLDPSSAEESAADGSITFSMNAYKELCSVSKPGGVALPADTVITAAALCARYVQVLHDALAAALGQLEEQVLQQRALRQEVLRRQQALRAAAVGSGKQESEGVQMEVEELQVMTGVDRNDPILQWANLHQAARLRGE